MGGEERVPEKGVRKEKRRNEHPAIQRPGKSQGEEGGPESRIRNLKEIGGGKRRGA